MGKLNPGLVRRGNRIWIDKRICGVRIQRSTGLDYNPAYFSLANKKLQDLIWAMETGNIEEERPFKSCKEAASRYLGSLEKKSSGTMQRAISALDNVLGFRLGDGRLIGGIGVREVSYSLMEEFLEANSHRWARGIGEDMNTFKRVLNHAARRWRDEQGRPWIDFVPEFPRPEGPQKVAHVLSREEERALVSALPETLQPMALFGIHTGCRAGEICGLRWAYYRERDGIAYFSLPASLTKMKRERPVVLNQSARRIVEGRGRDFVFENRSMNTPAWKRAWETAGLPLTEEIMKGPHNLRHTFAFRLRDTGVPEWTVKDALGHKGDVTRIYAKPSLEAILEAVEAPYLVAKRWHMQRPTSNPLI